MSVSPSQLACPACGSLVAVPFFDGGSQPLATLQRPRSTEDARAATRLPLDYVRCVVCGHVYNAAFDAARVPGAASHPGWGMFNGAALWTDFMRGVAERLARALPEGALVVELGHGSGSFLAMIARARSDVRCLGFDPYGAEERADRIELRRALLEPDAVPALGAHLLVMRHVLEHLAAPLGLLQRLAFAASTRPTNGGQRIYLEVPCIDRALATGRTADFFYEHCQQFTTRSFLAMIERVGGAIDEHGHGYDGEVVHALVRLGSGRFAETAREAQVFDAKARGARDAIRAQLAELASSKKQICVWGGAGKGAAFIARYEMDAQRFPIVVDSDASKVATFVAGTGQEIRDPNYLIQNPADVIIIPPQWRARDIVLEMRKKNIRCGIVLIEHDGRLVDYERDPHPYAK